MGAPTLRVRQGKPAHKSRQLAVDVRLDHEMPVIGHQAPCQEVDSVALDGFLEDRFERVVVRVFFDNRHPRIATIST